MTHLTHHEQRHQVFCANLSLLLGRRYTGLRSRLADYLGVPPYTITRILNGTSPLPPPTVLDKIAFFFALPTSALFKPDLSPMLSSTSHHLMAELTQELVNMSDEDAAAAMPKIIALIKQMRDKQVAKPALCSFLSAPARLPARGTSTRSPPTSLCATL